MSETNGHGEHGESFSERLKRLEESHVKLMTDHEVFVREHDKRIAERDIDWERQQKLWEKHEVQHQEWLEADKALGKRIEELISGFGAFIAKLEKTVGRP